MIKYSSLFLQGLKIILIHTGEHTQYMVFKFNLLYTCMPCNFTMLLLIVFMSCILCNV